MYPTLSPANGGKPATPHYAGLEDDNDDEEGGVDGQGNSTSPNPDNTGGSDGGSSAASKAGESVRGVLTLLLLAPFALML